MLMLKKLLDLDLTLELQFAIVSVLLLARVIRLEVFLVNDLASILLLLLGHFYHTEAGGKATLSEPFSLDELSRPIRA